MLAGSMVMMTTKKSKHMVNEGEAKVGIRVGE
jgi:hypothetical protein